MIENYTQEVLNSYLDLRDNELDDARNILENISPKSTEETWKKQLTDIAKQYMYSSRHALMRIIFSRATGIEPSGANEKSHFDIVAKDNITYHFENLSHSYAESIKKTELKKYESVLLEMASKQPDADIHAYTDLINKALYKGTKTLLSRFEAMRLGHMLGFSTKEMQWFLLRVFESDAGIAYNSSEDIIDVYGFENQLSWQRVDKLKNEYQEKSKKIRKEESGDEKTNNWTQNIGKSLIRQIKEWNESPENSELLFMQWILRQSPYLDLPSKTATKIYRCLASYAYYMLENEQDDIQVNDLVEKVYQICEGDEDSIGELLKIYSEEENAEKVQCEKVSSALLTTNKNTFSAESDRAKAWCAIRNDRGKTKLVTARQFVYNEKGTYSGTIVRVTEILRGTIKVEKWDMLYLLWYTFNQCWIKNPLYYQDEKLFNNLADFLDAADLVLNAALLPPFYPPHTLEQTMMLAIVSSNDTGVPGDVYEEMCECL